MATGMCSFAEAARLCAAQLRHDRHSDDDLRGAFTQLSARPPATTWPSRKCRSERLLAKSSPLQKVVLEGLCDQLQLTSEDRFDEAKHLEEILESQRKIAERIERRRTTKPDRLAGQMRSRLLQKWPELSNPWHPRIAELMKADGPQIQTAIEGDSDYARWDLLHRDAEKFYDKALDLERHWVKCQRCVRTLTKRRRPGAEPEKVASPEIVERYNQMLEDEAGAFGKSESRNPKSESNPNSQ